MPWRLTRMARLLSALPRSLVVTRALNVALASLSRGLRAILIGGRLSEFDGNAVGQGPAHNLSALAADLCGLGACGLGPEFGFSADDRDESAAKQATLSVSYRSVVVTGTAKLGRRARHRVAHCAALDVLVADGFPGEALAAAKTGMEIRNA